MTIDRIGYRSLAPERVSPWRQVWAVSRWNLRVIFRRKLFWTLVGFGAMHFLLHFALIYTKAQILARQPGFARFLEQYLVTGDGEAYRDFLNVQSRGVLLLLAYAGVVLIAGDHRLGGVAFYLSKPIRRRHYVLGKVLALAVIAGLLTLAPGLVLFAEYGLFANSLDYFRENPRIAVGICGYGLLVMTVPGLLLVALGTLCRGSASLILAWCGIFFVLPLAGVLLQHVFEQPAWRLLSLWRCLHVLGTECFGTTTGSGGDPGLWWVTAVVAAVCLASVGVLARKLRAVEVVR